MIRRLTLRLSGVTPHSARVSPGFLFMKKSEHRKPKRQHRPGSVTIACFGEALWDVLPRGIFLGGAPLNVAYHRSRQGVRAIPITAVGRDFLGAEIIRRAHAWGLDLRFIARVRRAPTGTVRAELDSRGVARYAIATRVAWDRITVSPRLRETTRPNAIVFGTLALRTVENRRALAKALSAWPDALRVLDLNLRRPFDRGVGVIRALAEAQFVKLNDEELARMVGARSLRIPQLESAARRFAAVHQLSRVCVTAGEHGAGLLWDDAWFWEPGRPVTIRDTIGAGDSFLAAFLAAHLLRGESPRRALAAACRMGEFVAARDGATPAYDCNDRGRPDESRAL